jgi:hypothetical protein
MGRRLQNRRRRLDNKQRRRIQLRLEQHHGPDEHFHVLWPDDPGLETGLLRRQSARDARADQLLPRRGRLRAVQLLSDGPSADCADGCE